MSISSKRWIPLWVAAFAVAMVSVSWKLFVPSMANYPIWRDYFTTSLNFMIVLLLPEKLVASIRDYFQKAHFNTPFRVSVGLFLIVCLAVLVNSFTGMVNPENCALAVCVVFLLLAGPVTESGLSRMTNLIIPFMFTLGVTVSLSFVLPRFRSDIHFAGALTCVYTAWLLASVLDKSGTYVRDNWIRAIISPTVHTVFLGIAAAIGSHESLPYALSEWLNYISHYSLLPATERVPAIVVSVAIPLLSAALISLIFWLAGRRSETLDFYEIFVPIVWSLLTVVGLLSFFGVLPSGNSVFPMPFQCPVSSLPMAMAVRTIGRAPSKVLT